MLALCALSAEQIAAGEPVTGHVWVNRPFGLLYWAYSRLGRAGAGFDETNLLKNRTQPRILASSEMTLNRRNKIVGIYMLVNDQSYFSAAGLPFFWTIFLAVFLLILEGNSSTFRQTHSNCIQGLV